MIEGEMGRKATPRIGGESWHGPASKRLSPHQGFIQGGGGLKTWEPPPPPKAPLKNLGN